MLPRLKNFTSNKAETIEELLSLVAFGKALRTEYEASDIEVPKWLIENLKSVSREIDLRNVDAVEARLANAKNLREGLKTTAEKRDDLDAEIARLTKKRKAMGA